MADDRPALSDVELIAALQKRLDDLESTLLARVNRSTTGTIDQTILTTAPPDTLFLQGQTLNRADYPVLWQWASDNGRVVTGLFGAGDGTTTFVLPDFRNRVLVGGGALAPGATVGADSVTLALGNLPAHDHNVSVGTSSSSGSHFHAISANTGSDGSHINHFADSGYDIMTNGSGGAISGHLSRDSPRLTEPNHTHTLNTNTGTTGAHTHTATVTESTIGSGTAVDVRQSSIAINWLIWT
jgi:microcystin-dependent protein